MITFIQQKRPSLIYRLMSCFIVFSFIFSSVLIPNQAYAQFAPNTVLNLPVPGTLLNVTTGFQPALIKGIMTHPENPLEFDFIVVQGDNKLSGEVFNEEARNMIKYFLAALTTPEDEMWVNLSPYEGNRIIPAGLGTTEMGRDLLAQDYILKQLTASLMYPEDKLGGEFWNRVHKKALALYGTTDIPMNTFNKIWIVPGSATVYQKGSNAFVVENKLKVMLEEDYNALNANLGNKQFGADQVNKEEAEIISGVTSEVVREVLIPEIEYEVNHGQHFAKLRQIANAMVLATWYKQALRESLLGHVYIDQNKTKGIDVVDKAIKDKIYEQYIEAFQKGVYNYIKEYYDPTTEEVIPRKYFSGGFDGDWTAATTTLVEGRDVVPARVQDLMQREFGQQPEENVLAVKIDLIDAGPAADPTTIAQVVDAAERTSVDLNLGRDRVSLTPKQSDQAVLVKTEYLGTDAIRTIARYREEGRSFEARPIEQFENIRAFFSLKGKAFPATENMFVVPSERITFGVALEEVEGQQQLIVEQAFLNRINQLNNPFDMLSRALVYVLNRGTHEENKIAEYDYTVQQFGEDRILADIQKKGLPSVQVVYQNFMSDLFVSKEGQDQMTQEISKRLKQALWEIGLNSLDKPETSTPKGRRVIINKSDKPYDVSDQEDGREDVEIGILAISANPEHWGQTETALRAMAQKKLDQIVVIVQGDDYRKPILRKTEQARHEQVKMRLRSFGGLVVYSDWSKGNQNIGEESLEEMILANKGRQGKIVWHYIVGNDHQHYYAPDAKSKDNEGIRRIPKTGTGANGYEPDTIQKLAVTKDKLAEFMAQNRVDLRIGFNVRDWQDGVPLTEEKEILAELEGQGFIYEVPGVNLPGVSSTKLRRVLSGELPVSNAGFMTQSVYNFIMRDGKYRGLITDLPQSVRATSDKLDQGLDISSDENLNQLVLWLAAENEQGRVIDANQFYSIFFEGIDKEIVEGFAVVQRAEPELYVPATNVRKIFEAVKPRLESYVAGQSPNTPRGADSAVLATDLSIREHRINGQSVESILGKIIKEYDIRGFDGFGDKTKFPQQMDETLLRWIGRGLATTEFRSDVHERTVSLKEGDIFVIAGDNGPSTQWVKDNLIEGLREAGIKVIDLGGSREGETSVTSGHLYKSIKTLGAQGGLYVTRSHVEVGTNGAKPNIGGITLYGDMLMKMKETILSGQYHQAETPGELDVSQATRDLARQEYYRSLRDQFAGLKEKLESSGMKVSVNFAGGSSTSYRDLFQELLGTSLVRIIRDRSDPFNEEGGLADPSRADTVALANEKENVIAYSLEHPDEHIINFDLDADRVSLVLNGRLYLGDEIFYPVIEYMLTIDQYKDINLKQPVWVDSRMKSTVAQLAMYFGGIALKHPKGHSKVKATMDIMLQNIARDQGFDSVQAFLDANPGYFNAQAEYSLHMFRTNQRGEAFDDAIDFGLFWLDVFSQVKNKYGQPQWTYADYVQHLTDLGAIAPPVQLNEQRFPMNEEAKMEVMREATRLIQAYFQGRTDFTYEPSWRERTTTPAAFHLVNVDGVFDFETPIGQAFWGWSNTSPKDAFGVQSENAEQTRRLTEVITAILIHSRESVGQRLGLNLGKIDDTETAGLMNMFGVQSAVDRLGLDLTGISENDVSTLKGMRDVGAIVKKAKELGLDTSRYAASSPAQLSDLTKQFAQARSNELEAGILAKYPTVTSALEGLTSDSAALAQAKESFETDLRQVIMRTVANRQERIFDSMLADVMNKRERILANKDVIDSNDLTFFETLPAVLESLRVQLSPDTLGKLSLDELKVLNAQMQALQKKMERIWTLDFVQISSIIAASSYKPTLEEQERRVPARFFDSDIARREAIQKTQGVQPRWGSERADTIDAAVLVTVKDEDIDSLVQAINRELDTLLAVEENRAGTILAELKEADQNKFTRAFGERDYQINGRQFVTALAGQLSLAAVDLAQAFSRSPNSLLAELGREASSLQLPGVTARAAIGIGEDEGYVETAGITETTGQQAATPVGGIDLNPKLLDLQIRRDDSGVPLPFNQQPIENMNIDGFIPVIINVTPVNNLPLILGLKEEDKEKIAGHVEGGEEPLQLSYMIKVDKFKLNESLE